MQAFTTFIEWMTFAHFFQALGWGVVIVLGVILLELLVL